MKNQNLMLRVHGQLKKSLEAGNENIEL